MELTLGFFEECLAKNVIPTYNIKVKRVVWLAIRNEKNGNSFVAVSG